MHLSKAAHRDAAMNSAKVSYRQCSLRARLPLLPMRTKLRLRGRVLLLQRCLIVFVVVVVVVVVVLISLLQTYFINVPCWVYLHNLSLETFFSLKTVPCFDSDCELL